MTQSIMQALLRSLLTYLGFLLPMLLCLTFAEHRLAALMHHATMAGSRRHRSPSIRRALAKGIKSLWKEWLVPTTTSPHVYYWAPVLTLGLALVLPLPIPLGPALGHLDALISWRTGVGDWGIFLFLGVAAADSTSVLFSAWATGNHFSLSAGLRAYGQRLTMFVLLTLSIASAFLALGTAELSQAVDAQSELVWSLVPRLGILLQPLGALPFLWVLYQESPSAPLGFFSSSSETAYTLEYSTGAEWVYSLAQTIRLIAWAAIFCTLFLGGFHVPVLLEGATLFGSLEVSDLVTSVLALVIFSLKVLTVLLIVLVVRWSGARARIAYRTHLALKRLLPLSLINLILSGLFIYLDPTGDSLLIMGLGLWTLLILIAVLGPRRSDAIQSRTSPQRGPLSALPAMFAAVRTTMTHLLQSLGATSRASPRLPPSVLQLTATSCLRRGVHRLVPRPDGNPRCVACHLCEEVCPASCVQVTSVAGEDTTLEKRPTIFGIDELRCASCGLCVEACPVDALRMDTAAALPPVGDRRDAELGMLDLMEQEGQTPEATDRLTSR